MGFKANNGIFVARSGDGGQTWQPAVAVTSHQFGGTTQVPFEIYPDMAVDLVRTLPEGHPNPNYGNLYVTWARYYPAGQFPGEVNSAGGSDVMIAVSQDGGLTWQLRTRPAAGTEVGETVLQTRFNTGSDQQPGRGYRTWPRVAVVRGGRVGGRLCRSLVLRQPFRRCGCEFLRVQPGRLCRITVWPGAKLLTAGLTSNAFRTVPTRAIAADPTRPGHIYVAEPMPVLDAVGNPLDAADIFFARSDDYGRSWQTTILQGGLSARTVNDDNGGQMARGSPDDVTADVSILFGARAMGHFCPKNSRVAEDSVPGRDGLG